MFPTISNSLLNATIWASVFSALALAAPASISKGKRDYNPGWCGLHLTQFQKPNPAVDSYRIQVNIKDATGNLIGYSGVVSSAQPVDVDSELPYVLIIETGNNDGDPVQFLYAGQAWDSASRQCSVGRYDSGSRQMDCGFSC